VDPPPDASLGPSPSELDPLIRWLDVASDGLVLLEPYRLDDLRGMVRRVAEVVATHTREYDARLGAEPPPGGRPATWALLRADHAWFSVSLEQLAWFFGIVENEDHGGHRQALGQYGRLLAEALRRHRDLEREYFRRSSAAVVPAGQP
jgi:hypothetical protein